MAAISDSRSLLFSHPTELFLLSSHRALSHSLQKLLLPPFLPIYLLPFVFNSLGPLAASKSQQQHRVLRCNVVEILEEGGLLESITSDSLRTACSDPVAGPFKVCSGFDPTAESLHLGNLLGLIVLSWFRRCGHKVVVVIGGATARIGDPSGKTLERPGLDADTLEKNSRY